MMVNSLQSYLDVLIRRWKIAAVMPVLAAAAAALVSLAMPPVYEATAVVALAPATLSVPTANQVPPYYLVVDSPRRLPTAYTPAYYVALLKGVEVDAAAIPASAVTITSSSSDKSLIEITARSADPKLAAAGASAWANAGALRVQQALLPSREELVAGQSKLDAAQQALVKFSRENGLGDYDLAKLRGSNSLSTEKKLELAGLLRARDTAEAVYLDFAREFEHATILAASAYRPTVLPATAPTMPVSPKPIQNTIVGGALGLLLGLLSAFVVDAVSKS